MQHLPSGEIEVVMGIIADGLRDSVFDTDYGNAC